MSKPSNLVPKFPLRSLVINMFDSLLLSIFKSYQISQYYKIQKIKLNYLRRIDEILIKEDLKGFECRNFIRCKCVILEGDYLVIIRNTQMKRCILNFTQKQRWY
jgi:hypothetical protein